MDFKAKDNVCLYGPWMADILDINASFGVPATDDRIPARVHLRKNNEIIGINQMWRRKGDEIQLVSIVDGTGYFKNIGNNEVQASGLSQRMRFYVAFEFAARETAVTPNIEYDVNGVSFDLTGGQGLSDFQPHTVTLKYDGATRVKINDNSVDEDPTDAPRVLRTRSERGQITRASKATSSWRRTRLPSRVEASTFP